MKKIIYFILFMQLFLFSSNIFALDVEYNTESNVKKAILVEDYISRHKEKIENFLNIYNISNNTDLQKDINILNESIEALKKIENTEVEKEKADKVLQAVIARIKNVNESLKIKLKKEKEIFERKLSLKKAAYTKLGIKLSDKIDSINLKIATNIFKDKKILSEDELKVKENLIKLNRESLKLRNFGSMDFWSEKEIRESFIKILQNIKTEIALMKTTLK